MAPVGQRKISERSDRNKKYHLTSLSANGTSMIPVVEWSMLITGAYTLEGDNVRSFHRLPSLHVFPKKSIYVRILN